LSKRLKRRIHEVCGLLPLKREQRIQRAKEILDDLAEKQAICNKVVGASFKDVERALKDIISDRKVSSKTDEIDREVEELSPQKLRPELEVTRRAYDPAPTDMLLDPDEVNALLNATETSKATERVPELDPESYRTYSFEEVAALMDCNYNPESFKYTR
jgi:hypothetical protein